MSSVGRKDRMLSKDAEGALVRYGGVIDVQLIECLSVSSPLCMFITGLKQRVLVSSQFIFGFRSAWLHLSKTVRAIYSFVYLCVHFNKC